MPIELLVGIAAGASCFCFGILAALCFWNYRGKKRPIEVDVMFDDVFDAEKNSVDLGLERPTARPRMVEQSVDLGSERPIARPRMVEQSVDLGSERPIANARRASFSIDLGGPLEATSVTESLQPSQQTKSRSLASRFRLVSRKL